jgi:hypothetical protein
MLSKRRLGAPWDWCQGRTSSTLGLVPGTDQQHPGTGARDGPAAPWDWCKGRTSSKARLQLMAGLQPQRDAG